MHALLCTAVLPALAWTAQSSESTYRDLFDAGVTALARGDREAAVAHFESAGERAPEAPLWRRYLDHASGRSSAPADARDGLFRWQWLEVPPSSGNSKAHLSADGARILVPWGRDAMLFEATTSELVARLRAPQAIGDENGFCSWTLDLTGRVALVLGGHGGTGRGLDLRDASTGRPIEVEGADSIALSPGARFEWFALEEEVPENVFPGTRDLRGAEGTLRCHIVREAVSDRGVQPVRRVGLSGDAALAVVTYSTGPGSTKLIDRRTGETRFLWEPAIWGATFSDDATMLLGSKRGEGRVLIDVATGNEVWRAPAPEGPSDGQATRFMFAGNELVSLDAAGTFRNVDVETGRAGREIRLTPAPVMDFGGCAVVRDGTRLVTYERDHTSVYDLASGRRLWRAEGPRWLMSPDEDGIDTAEMRCLIVPRSRWPYAVDLGTGVKLDDGAAPTRLATTAVERTPGGDRAVVALSNGELRLVELESGATVARAFEHVGRTAHFVHGSRQSGFVTRDKRAIYLRDAETLDPILSARLEPRSVVRAVHPEGTSLVSSRSEPPATKLIELTEDGAGRLILVTEHETRAAGYRADGSQVALAANVEVFVLDATDGEVVSKFTVPEGAKPSAASFYGDSILLVGEDRTAPESPDGLTSPPARTFVMDLATGVEIAALEQPTIFGLDRVECIHSAPGEGVVVVTLSDCGEVNAYSEEGWKPRWQLGSLGGDWVTLEIRREPGAELACVSGMLGQNARIFELATGKVRDRAATQGMLDLALTNGGDRAIGLRDRSLVALDTQSLQIEYARQESPDGHAWIEVGGRRRLAAGGPENPAVDRAHVIRDGWSAPVSCFDPWLHDPLNLGEPSLEALPALPVVRSVSRREGGLELVLDSEDPVIGVLLVGADRTPRFHRVDRVAPGESVTVSVDAPIQVGRRVSVVTDRGVASRSYRAD
ncbi:MAG: PQQ-binding-like beta-propeller repeat protein [Planctomycetota bacterium]